MHAYTCIHTRIHTHTHVYDIGLIVGRKDTTVCVVCGGLEYVNMA